VSSSSSAPAASPGGPITLVPVLRDSLRYWRRYFRYLTPIAALLWLPLGVLEVTGVAHGVEIDVEQFHPGDVVVNIVIVIVLELLVAELLAAAAEKIVSSELRHTELQSGRKFLTTVPWLSLVLATLVYETGVAIGTLFFVIPGYVIATWGVVTGPVVVAEHSRAVRAPGRSRDLVRGSFRPVAIFVFIVFVVGEAITLAAGTLLELLPRGWPEPVGEYLVRVATSPLFGMATAVLYYALVAREQARKRDEPAEAGPSM
jgi:hypothetical protein